MLIVLVINSKGMPCCVASVIEGRVGYSNCGVLEML